MWALNCFFFCVIFAALRTGDLLSILPVSVVYIVLLNWLTEEDKDGTDYVTERPSSHDNHTDNWILDDTHSNLDNTKT